MQYPNGHSMLWIFASDGTPYHIEVGFDGLESTPLHLKIGEVVLEQFTGLTDKNGKEIYEGDVVRLISGGSRWNREACEVVFLNGSFQFNRPDWPYPCGFITYAMSCSERYIIDDHSELCSQIEVIGNIHENPELI